MQDDDVLPNDGTYFFPREPQEQILGRKKEKAQTLEGINELKAILERLDNQVAFFDSLSSIPDEVRLDPEKFLIMHNTHTQVAEILRSEREYIADLVSTHLK